MIRDLLWDNVLLSMIGIEIEQIDEEIDIDRHSIQWKVIEIVHRLIDH